MSTITIDPPNQTLSPPPAPRRRFTRWIVGALVLTLVSLGILAGSFVSGYQPIVVTGSMLYTANSADGTSPDSTYGPFMVNYIAGATELYGFDIRNAGRYPITITGAEWHGPSAPFGKVEFAVPTPAANAGATAIGLDRGLQAIRPFSLAPGRQVTIYMRFTMGGCIVPTSGAGQGGFWTTADGIYIDFRALGLSHRTAISGPADGQLQILVPPNAVCA